ncbi:MAG TPA: aldehyde dehydrogenase family protein [Candidatus Brocadiia bacterium]|nr:aldehyde dehydrogenase family protein [Planctomycetota bacterium]MDO8094623.1 aldehyde dehydrogenase family protein [Candidatus Brocadiales bacterium]
MSQTYKYLAGGKWQESSDVLEVINPFNDEVAGITYRAKGSDIEKSIQASVKAFDETRRLPSYKRAEILSNIRNGLVEGSEGLARMIALEAGKPITDSRREVNRAIGVFQIASEEAKRIGGEFIPLDLFEASKGRVGINKRFPLGPILGITPFNFPLNLACHKIAPAIAAGNTIVIKPASKTPITALLLAEIVSQSGLPEGAFSVLPCSSDVAERMVKDDRFRMLTFTGSSAVGWRLKNIAGKKRVTLELGGNAGTIIDEDADLELATKRCVYGGFTFSGQTCISLQRIYVHEKIYKRFLSDFVAQVTELKIGNPLDETTSIGPMFNINAAERAGSWIKDAVKGGAKALTGGKRKGKIVEPTVLIDTNPDMKVNCEEVFAPVVTVTKFTSFEDALTQLNNTRYGLQASIFCNDIKKVFMAYNTIDVGGLIINDVPTYRMDHMPYGGTKESGMGREGIKYAIEEMTEPKLLVLNLL